MTTHFSRNPTCANARGPESLRRKKDARLQMRTSLPSQGQDGLQSCAKLMCKLILRKKSHPWTTHPNFQKRWEGKVRLQFSWIPGVGRIPEVHQAQGRRKCTSFQAPFTHGNGLVSTLIRTGSRAKGELAGRFAARYMAGPSWEEHSHDESGTQKQDSSPEKQHALAQSLSKSACKLYTPGI